MVERVTEGQRDGMRRREGDGVRGRDVVERVTEGQWEGGCVLERVTEGQREGGRGGGRGEEGRAGVREGRRRGGNEGAYRAPGTWLPPEIYYSCIYIHT